MAEVKCIACNRVNARGDRFCAACGSSLDLKLCAYCEAINNPVADACHSCGRPLAAEEAPPLPAVEEISEAPFYAPKRFEPVDEAPRRSVASRLARAAKVTTLVVLPLAAIALWGWQLYGPKLLNTPYVQDLLRTPYAQKVLSYLPSVRMPAAGSPLPGVEVPKAKPVAAEIKLAPPSPSSDKPASTEASTGKSAAASTPKAATTANTPTANTPPPPLTGGTASCPRAAAILGLCDPNTKKGGS